MILAMPTPSSHKTVRPPVLRVLICALILAVGYYSYHLGSVTAHRENSLNELDGMANTWKGIEAKVVKIAAHRPEPGAKISESQVKAMSRINDESAALRRRFIVFENRVRRKNDNVIPQWLKDDPNWQELNHLYQRRQND
jgi:hypothetical protein